MGQERSCLVQQSLKSVKCGIIDHFDWELISRDGKPHREVYFPLEPTETAVAQLEVMSLRVSLRWNLKIPLAANQGDR